MCNSFHLLYFMTFFILVSATVTHNQTISPSNFAVNPKQLYGQSNNAYFLPFSFHEKSYYSLHKETVLLDVEKKNSELDDSHIRKRLSSLLSFIYMFYFYLILFSFIPSFVLFDPNGNFCFCLFELHNMSIIKIRNNPFKSGSNFIFVQINNPININNS